MIRGEIVWFFAYDVAFECRMESAAAKLAGRSGFRKPHHHRGTPQGAAIYTPLELELGAARHAGPPAFEGVRRTVRIYSMGAVSVTLRLPFEEESLDELLPGCLIGEIEDSELRQLARASAEEVVRELGDALVRPQPSWERCEAYKVICITAAPGLEGGARKWLAGHRAEVAALLLGEGRPGTWPPSRSTRACAWPTPSPSRTSPWSTGTACWPSTPRPSTRSCSTSPRSPPSR